MNEAHLELRLVKEAEVTRAPLVDVLVRGGYRVYLDVGPIKHDSENVELILTDEEAAALLQEEQIGPHIRSWKSGGSDTYS